MSIQGFPVELWPYVKRGRLDGRAGIYFPGSLLLYLIEARQAIFKILGMGWGEKCRKY